MKDSRRAQAGGCRQVALALSTAIAAMLAAAGAGVAATPAEPGSQRSATGQTHSRAVTGISPTQSQSRSAPRRRAASAPRRSRSSGTTGAADGRGANVSGPYDPSGVGLASGNGKSESNNGRRPCAGCVGRADTKNPPGQLPGGSDSNRGYECDANQGIGQTNPAHSRCSPTGTSGSPPAQASSSGGLAGLGLLGAGALRWVPPLVPAHALPASAPLTPEMAQAPSLVNAADVRPAGEAGPADEADPVPTDGSASPTPNAGELAFTGLGLAWMALLGAAFMVAGKALRRTDSAVALAQAANASDHTRHRVGTPV